MCESERETLLVYECVQFYSVTTDLQLLTGEPVMLFYLPSDVDVETFYRAACHASRTTQTGESLILSSLSRHSERLDLSLSSLLFFLQSSLQARPQSMPGLS